MKRYLFLVYFGQKLLIKTNNKPNNHDKKIFLIKKKPTNDMDLESMAGKKYLVAFQLVILNFNYKNHISKLSRCR